MNIPLIAGIATGVLIVIVLIIVIIRNRRESAPGANIQYKMPYEPRKPDSPADSHDSRQGFEDAGAVRKRSSIPLIIAVSILATGGIIMFYSMQTKGTALPKLFSREYLPIILGTVIPFIAALIAILSKKKRS
ncbi:hypothetical protein GX441_06115 [bacterium]|nr:hypothetical protein [bacterium]